MPKFDYIFFDSGGTLYHGETKGKNSASNFFHKRIERLYPQLQLHGYQGNLEELEIAIKHSEEICQQKYVAYLYNHSAVLIELKNLLQLTISDEECFHLTSLYSGPRMKEWLFKDTQLAIKELYQMGIKLGIIANTIWSGPCMDRAFAALGLLPYFQYRIYSGDIKLKKPDLEIFRYAENLASAKNKRILYVGNDIEKDIVPPQMIGWSTALRLPNEITKSDSPANYQFFNILELVEFCKD